MPWYDESWKDSYDAWKLRTPDWDYEEPEFICSACEDQGWEEGGWGLIYPCSECSQTLTLYDLDDLDFEERGG